MTIEEIKNKDYINATELQVLIPGLGYDNALGIIKELQEEMKQKNLYVPKTKPKLVLMKLVKKKFGI